MRNRNRNQNNIIFMLGSICLFLIFGLTNASELIPAGDYSITKGGCFCKIEADPNAKIYNFNFYSFANGLSTPVPAHK